MITNNQHLVLLLRLSRPWMLLLAVCVLSGCNQRFFPGDGNPYPAVPVANGPVGQAIPNPLPIPVADQEFAWSQIVDELEDYFRIRQSEQVRVIDGVVTDGWLETYPEIGSTHLENWRHDSTPGFEKLHATLQTVRRWSRVRVTPMGNAYHVEVQVFKELEDLDFPQDSTIGSVVASHATTPHFSRKTDDNEPVVRGWIPMGRDISLEQRILARLQARLTQFPENNSAPHRIWPFRSFGN